MSAEFFIRQVSSTITIQSDVTTCKELYSSLCDDSHCIKVNDKIIANNDTKFITLPGVTPGDTIDIVNNDIVYYDIGSNSYFRTHGIISRTLNTCQIYSNNSWSLREFELEKVAENEYKINDTVHISISGNKVVSEGHKYNIIPKPLPARTLSLFLNHPTKGYIAVNIDSKSTVFSVLKDICDDSFIYQLLDGSNIVLGIGSDKLMLCNLMDKNYTIGSTCRAYGSDYIHVSDMNLLYNIKQMAPVNDGKLLDNGEKLEVDNEIHEHTKPEDFLTPGYKKPQN